jgi:hypothetical protein
MTMWASVGLGRIYEGNVKTPATGSLGYKFNQHSKLLYQTKQDKLHS